MMVECKLHQRFYVATEGCSWCPPVLSETDYRSKIVGFFKACLESNDTKTKALPVTYARWVLPGELAPAQLAMLNGPNMLRDVVEPYVKLRGPLLRPKLPHSFGTLRNTFMSAPTEDTDSAIWHWLQVVEGNTPIATSLLLMDWYVDMGLPESWMCANLRLGDAMVLAGSLLGAY